MIRGNRENLRLYERNEKCIGDGESLCEMTELYCVDRT